MADISVPQNIQELSKKAAGIYDSKKAEIEIKENEGKFIAIELESGKYFIGATRDEAVISSKKKYPNKLIFVRRIGAVEKISRHLSLPTAYNNARIF